MDEGDAESDGVKQREASQILPQCFQYEGMVARCREGDNKEVWHRG